MTDLSIRIDNDGHGYDFTMAEAADFLRVCPELQTLKLMVIVGGITTLNELSNLIENNRNIRNLKVELKSNIMPVLDKITVTLPDVQQFVNRHRAMVELELLSFRLTGVEMALLVVRRLASLKLFRFEIANRSEYEDMVSQLDNEWLSSTRGNFEITLQRR